MYVLMFDEKTIRMVLNIFLVFPEKNVHMTRFYINFWEFTDRLTLIHVSQFTYTGEKLAWHTNSIFKKSHM